MGTLLVWLSSTEENNSQSQQEIPVLQELLGEQGPLAAIGTRQTGIVLSALQQGKGGKN